MKKIEDKSIFDYIEMAKYNIILYTILFIVISIFLIFIAIKYKCKFYYLFILFPLFAVFAKIITYSNVCKIKDYLVENNLIKKIGKIVFWNYQDYFLTEKYMIIKVNKLIRCFKYDEIKEIEKVEYDTKTGLRYTYQYLIIKLKDYSVFKILIYTSKMVNEEYKDISGFLLSKNKKIIVK